MTIRLYFDEDSMRRSLVRSLRARGIDVVTALDAGMIECKDAEHLDYATEQGRVLCSFNVGVFVVCIAITWPKVNHTLGSSLCANNIIRSGSRCVVFSG
jgi:hypothetical protein